jgi:hypothetical protein
MLLRRDVIVGFFGFSRASAAACRLLPPEDCGVGRGASASGCECTEEADEGVADALGEAAGREVALGEALLAGAAMLLAFAAAVGGVRRIVGRKLEKKFGFGFGFGF